MSRTKGVDGDDTARIAGLFAARISAARAELLAAMESRGFSSAGGWRIHEEMINHPGGTAMRLRAVHRTETTPEGLDVIVRLD